MKNNIKVGFPINKLDDILRLLDSVNYAIIEKDKIVDIKEYENNKYKMQDNFTFKYPELIKNTENKINELKNDIEFRNNNTLSEFEITINNKTFYKRADAGQYLRVLMNTKTENGIKLETPVISVIASKVGLCRYVSLFLTFTTK